MCVCVVCVFLWVCGSDVCVFVGVWCVLMCGVCLCVVCAYVWCVCGLCLCVVCVWFVLMCGVCVCMCVCESVFRCHINRLHLKCVGR